MSLLRSIFFPLVLFCFLLFSRALSLFGSFSFALSISLSLGKWQTCNLISGKASVASNMGWLWTGWIGPTPVQMSGMLSVHRAVVIVFGLFRVWSFFSLTCRFFVNSQLDHFWAWIPACSLTTARLHCCFPSNLSTTTQGAIVKRTVLGYVGKRGWGVEGY